MGVQFIKQSSASSVGYTEKSDKNQSRPQPALPWHLCRVRKRLGNCCSSLLSSRMPWHPSEGGKCSSCWLCSRLGGWKGCWGAPGAPQGGQQRGWELHGAARGCSQGEPDLPCCCSRRHSLGGCGAHLLQAVPQCAPPAAPRLVPAGDGDTAALT